MGERKRALALDGQMDLGAPALLLTTGRPQKTRSSRVFSALLQKREDKSNFAGLL